MFIQVVCQNPKFPGRTRAKRRFENGAVHRMEVVDQVDDFFTDKDKKIADMTRINRAGYEAIKADPVFSVLADGETQGGIGADMLDAARASAAALSARVTALEIENAGFKTANERLEKQVAELTVALDAATKPAGEGAEGEETDETTAEKDKGGKGKHGAKGGGK